MVKIFSALLLAAVLPGAAPAQEAIHVSYHDLDLGSAQGVRMLDRRLDQAISAVCPDPYSVMPGARLAYRRCLTAKRIEIAAQRDQAIAQASRVRVALAPAR